MPKMKTNAAAKKRFSFTGTGKIKRKHAYHSHILTKKTKKQSVTSATQVSYLQPMRLRSSSCSLSNYGYEGLKKSS